MKHFITPFLNRLLHFQRESGRDRQRAEEGTWRVSLTVTLATKTGEQVHGLSFFYFIIRSEACGFGI